MKNNFLGEIIISIILIGLLSLFFNPIGLLMPQTMHGLMIPTLIIVSIILLGLLWKEKSGDERENLHKYIASRFSYFAAVVTLIIAIIVENNQHALDPWLVIIVCVMLLAKIGGLMYGYLKH
jgi:predicted permease